MRNKYKYEAMAVSIIYASMFACVAAVGIAIVLTSK